MVFDWDLVHPSIRSDFIKLDQTLLKSFDLGITKTNFRPFEGYRSPARQQLLFDQRVTRARPCQSAHQFGLAVDFVPFVDGKWNWDDPSHDWAFLRTTCRAYGLLNELDWDRAHVEHRRWPSVYAAMQPGLSGVAA